MRVRVALILACVVLVALQVPRVLVAWRDALQWWEVLPAEADAIFILMGDVVPRAMYAGAIARDLGVRYVAMAKPQGNAATALGLSPTEDQVACAILKTLAVPDSLVVVIPGGAQSTFEEAMLARWWVETRGIRSVVFVTSSYHTARARWILRRVLRGLPLALCVAGVPDPHVDCGRWWLSEEGLLTVFNETVKTFHSRLVYGGRHG